MTDLFNIHQELYDLARAVPKPVQQDLFDVTQQAIDQADAHANVQWKKEANIAVRVLAATWTAFTTDQVWERIKSGTPEPRAMGAIMQQAVKDGVIVPTGQWIPSRRKESHRRPIRVYRRPMKP